MFTDAIVQALAPNHLLRFSGPIGSTDLINSLYSEPTLRLMGKKAVASAVNRLAQTHPEWATRSTATRFYMGREVHPWIWSITNS